MVQHAHFRLTEPGRIPAEREGALNPTQHEYRERSRQVQSRASEKLDGPKARNIVVVVLGALTLVAGVVAVSPMHIG
jgi:hypothetical protein